MIRTLAAAMCAAAALAFAVDPDRTIAQMYHTAWTIEDGAPSSISALAQTNDGYLWLGTFDGLFRFDGVRFERYQPERGDPLLSQDISALLATPDGGLWIGFRTGGATFLEAGRGHSYGEKAGLPSSTVTEFVLDQKGAIWAGTTHGLFRFINSRWEKIGKEWGFFADQAHNLFVDQQGKFWVEGNTDLYALPPGAHRFEMRKLSHGWLLRQTPDGTLWFGEVTKGIRAVSGPLAESYDPSKAALNWSPGRTMIVDREGSFWMSLDPAIGVRRVASPERLPGRAVDLTSSAVQKFTREDGLSSDGIRDILEDHEGNLWIATFTGLDRFRAKNVVQSRFPPLTDGYDALLIADREGVVWEGTGPSLLTVASDGASLREGPQPRQTLSGKAPKMTCAWRDFEGAVWLGGTGTLTRWTAGRIEDVEFPDKKLAGGAWDVQSITGDRAGDLWVSIQQHGVYRRHAGLWTQYGNLPELPKTTAVILWTDPQDRVWFGYMGDRIALLEKGRVRTFSASDGLHVGNVLAIGGRGDRIWAAGQFGLALFDGNRFQTIAGPADSAFQGVSGVVETAGGDFWLNMANGVARIPAVEIANRLSDPQHKLQYDRFDFRDGVRGTATPLRPLPSAVEGADGRIWLSRSSGVYWIDPAHIHRNPIPPPVTIEAIYAGDERFSALQAARLPKLPQNVRIEYTALSLSIPERVRFRYRLEGYDKKWQDVGTRRTAYYPNLPPGHFRFEVIACNDDGVWNNTGAAAEIAVAAAFYQTAWFEALCAFAALAILWGLYRYRLRQVAREFNLRLEERVSERTRLARDLHDTLLQSFHGLMLRFAVVSKMLPEGNAKDELENTLDRADRAIDEGRSAVYDLRSSATTSNDLAEAVNAVGDELSEAKGTLFHLTVEGSSRELHPIIRDEIYRIAREALTNAFRHAHADHIEAELSYGPHAFRLRIRDDGDGIPAEVVDRGRTGHFGLPGMRERARQAGAELIIWSRPGSGTEIDLSVSGAIAYATSPQRSWFWRFRAEREREK